MFEADPLEHNDAEQGTRPDLRHFETARDDGSTASGVPWDVNALNSGMTSAPVHHSPDLTGEGQRLSDKVTSEWFVEASTVHKEMRIAIHICDEQNQRGLDQKLATAAMYAYDRASLKPNAETVDDHQERMTFTVCGALLLMKNDWMFWQPALGQLKAALSLKDLNTYYDQHQQEVQLDISHFVKTSIIDRFVETGDLPFFEELFHQSVDLGMNGISPLHNQSTSAIDDTIYLGFTSRAHSPGDVTKSMLVDEPPEDTTPEE